MKKNELLCSAWYLDYWNCLQYGPTLECTDGCGRNTYTIGYLDINVLIKSKNFMVKASAFSSIFSTFTRCTAKIILFF